MTGPFAGPDGRWLDETGRVLPPPDEASARVGPDAAPGLLDRPVAFPLGGRVPLGRPDGDDLDRHLTRYGPRPDATGEGGRALLDALADIELSGHGGGHFPVARKWRAVLAAGGGTAVANGAEGEPASAKDAALLQLRPHLVLDGLALAAEATRARQAVVWLHEGDDRTLSALRRALAERRDSYCDVAIRIAVGPDRYLTGESSAVVRALDGGPALPYLTRRPTAVAGVGGRPTLLHNAETLARISLVARGGPDLPLEGPLVTVVGTDRRVVLAAEPGETFARLLPRSGVLDREPAAVLVGGYGGSWLSWPALAAVGVADPALRAVGAGLGAGVVAPLRPGACGLAETARLLAYLGASGARQCGPCLNGLPALADLFHRLVAGRADPADLRTIDRYAAQVVGRGACHHPDGAVQLARSALRTFAPDVERHRTIGPCPGVGTSGSFPLPAGFA